jgi:hypothetical protein
MADNHLMGKKKTIPKYGIGEWYGRRMETIPEADRLKYAQGKKCDKQPCPSCPDGSLCSKSGGICSLALYVLDEHGTVTISRVGSDMATICPTRFWESYTVFKKVGEIVLGTDKPTVITEVPFLQSVDHAGAITDESAGRIDMVLVKVDARGCIVDWCALEMQAVYISGTSIGDEFSAIKEHPDRLLMPKATHRPDFRSSGPKRLMPQLQVKVPSLRRWGKKTVVVIDKPFYESIAPMKKVPHLSNADIAWIIIDFGGENGQLRVSDSLFTTLESSVEGLTAGEPIAKDEFENALHSYITKRTDKVIVLE